MDIDDSNESLVQSRRNGNEANWAHAQSLKVFVIYFFYSVVVNYLKTKFGNGLRNNNYGVNPKNINCESILDEYTSKEGNRIGCT